MPADEARSAAPHEQSYSSTPKKLLAMKKQSLAALGLSALLLAACSESSHEFHQTFFYPTNPAGRMVYADQESDTLRLVSYDSWTISSSAEWLSVSPASLTIGPATGVSQKLDIKTAPNATGKNRTGYLTVNSYFTIGTSIRQTYWLNIEKPTVGLSAQGNAAPTATSAFEDYTADFHMSLKADTTSAEVVFTVYKDGATLTTPDTWITLPSDTYDEGRHTVKFTFGKNTGPARQATLTLTSNGVSTPIRVTQEASE